MASQAKAAIQGARVANQAQTTPKPANNVKPSTPQASQASQAPQSAKPSKPSNKASNNSENNKPKVKVMTVFNMIPSLLHTFVKVLPIGLYACTLLESILFNDIRGFFIFFGLLINDVINIGYAHLMQPKKNMNCAIVRNIYSQDGIILSTPHTQYVAFILGFLLVSMYFKKVFYYSTFTVFIGLMGLTIWSRITVGCSDILDAVFNIVFGAFRGIIYYVIIKDFYEPEDVTPEDHWIEKKLKALFPVSDDLDELFT
jgi:hypothetical protein